MSSSDLGFLVDIDPDPVLTWYGETGERIELSRRVLANWVAKAANLLGEEFDAAGCALRVTVNLPDGHWREAYWRLAVAWLGLADAAPTAGVGTDILITTPDGQVADESRAPASTVSRAEILADTREAAVIVSLPMLARGGAEAFAPGLPSDIPVIDEARDLATYGDLMPPSAGPRPRAVPRDPDLRRVLVAGDGGTFARALDIWSAGGSVVVLPAGTSRTEVERLGAVERATTGP